MTPAPAERIVELSQFRSYRRPRSVLTVQLLDGLLAVHQAGCYIALLHPFRNVAGHDSGDQEPLFEREDRVETPNDARSFPPQIMADHRHVLFSSPYALYAVDVWSLRDFASTRERPQWHVLVDSSDEAAPKLACRPLPLDESRLALISQRSDGTYLWCVLDLRERLQSRPLRDLSDVSVPLPLTGATCHVDSILGQCLALATTEGHWVWRHADAVNCQMERLRRTWPSIAPGTLVANLHEESPLNFHALQHYVFHDQPPSGEQLRRFTWYYVCRGDLVGRVECYGVDLQTLERDYPSTLHDQGRTVPLGAYVEGESPDGPRRMLFWSGRKLTYNSGLQLRLLPGHGQIENIDEVAGVVFCDPVLTVIGLGGGSGTERPLMIRSLRHPDQYLRLSLPRIVADPFIWSRWLFTIELGDDGSLVLNRRDLQPTATAGTATGSGETPSSGCSGAGVRDEFPVAGPSPVEPARPPQRCQVFISAKSADYEYAHHIYQFLSERGIGVFFSDVSLPELGSSDYRREIDAKLDEAQHMIVVASSVEHAQAPWVEAEWGFFINEKRSGRKQGNLITVTVGDLKPEKLPASLRYYEVIPFDPKSLEKLLRYVRAK